MNRLFKIIGFGITTGVVALIFVGIIAGTEFGLLNILSRWIQNEEVKFSVMMFIFMFIFGCVIAFIETKSKHDQAK